MAEITVTVTGGLDGASQGAQAVVQTGFDHAALVAAGRSRADGLDFWMRHTTFGAVSAWGVIGLDTSACKVFFNIVQSVASGSATDDGYRLVFGDLGIRDSRLNATPGTEQPGGVVTYSVPSLTLPPPSFPMTQVSAYETKAVAYPDFAVFRRADLNENRRTFVQAEWRDISPEDWYEIRAVVRASRGGVGTVSPSWLSGSYRVRPGTPSFTQDTKGKFSASMELEQVLI